MLDCCLPIAHVVEGGIVLDQVGFNGQAAASTTRLSSCEMLMLTPR